MALQKAYIGCWPEAQYTYDDGCFLCAFATVPTWQALYRAVTRCGATAERQLGAPPSHPQAFVGPWRAEAPIPPP